MTPAFDWALRRIPYETPIADLPSLEAERISRGLYRVSSAVFVMTDNFSGDSPEPRVLAWLWAASELLAIRVYDSKPVGEWSEDLEPPPPAEVIGFQPLTFRGVRQGEGMLNRRTPHTAAYEFSSGLALYAEISRPGRQYYFIDPNPADDDPVVAVRFDLRFPEP